MPIGTSSRLLTKKIKGKLHSSYYANQVDSFAQEEVGSHNIDFEVGRDFMTDAYETNEWVRSIVDIIVERTDEVDIFPRPLSAKIGTNDGEVSDELKRKMENVLKLFFKPNSDLESFSSLKKKVAHDICVYDEAGIQIVRKIDRMGNTGIPIELYANVSGEELFVNPNKDGTLPNSNAYVQLRDRKVISHWNKYQFMNFIKNRRAGYANGISPITNLAYAVIGDFETINYNLKFFENNARPNIAFIFNKLGFGKGQGALDRAKSWYLKNHQGNPHMPLFMGSEKGDVDIKEFMMSQKDMEFIDWDMLLLYRIMSVYGMQAPVLGIQMRGTGTIDIAAATEQFKKNAIIPMAKLLVNTMNATLIWANENFGYDDIYLSTSNLDIDDAKKESEIDEKYLDRGVITINQVRNKLQMSPVDWGNEPFVPLNYSPLSVLLDYQSSKIESNLKSASSDKIDNNVNSDQNKELGMEGIYSALSDAQEENLTENLTEYLGKNFNLPTGLEKIDKTLLTDTIKGIIKNRESKSSYYIPNNIRINNAKSVADQYQLSWKNILKN